VTRGKQQLQLWKSVSVLLLQQHLRVRHERRRQHRQPQGPKEVACAARLCAAGEQQGLLKECTAGILV